MTKILALFACFILLFWPTDVFGQNLPSLLYGKDINSTFSIVAYDQTSEEWGIAVATDNIYVGNSTIYIEPGIGAFSVIAETEPLYAIEGLKQLKSGESINEVIENIRLNDEASHYRLVGGLDATGKPYAFTGETLKYWNGRAGHIIGKNYLVMGNQLAEGVLRDMAMTFESSEGTLAQRLLESLVSGQHAGGQLSGKQSAALVVKGINNEWFNQVNLRVDHSKEPINDLNNLLNYHYGRIRLNQALFAINVGNKELGTKRLTMAQSMLKGWYGMYGKLAYAYSMVKNDDKAISIIKEALREKNGWKVNLPAFYYLKSNPKFKNEIDTKSFSPKDWQNALMMLSNLKRFNEAIDLAGEVLKKKREHSYSYFILGQVYEQLDKAIKAQESYAVAYELDSNNIEAMKKLKNE